VCFFFLLTILVEAILPPAFPSALILVRRALGDSVPFPMILEASSSVVSLFLGGPFPHFYNFLADRPRRQFKKGPFFSRSFSLKGLLLMRLALSRQRFFFDPVRACFFPETVYQTYSGLLFLLF